jgi:hypothetical protein
MAPPRIVRTRRRRRVRRREGDRRKGPPRAPPTTDRTTKGSLAPSRDRVRLAKRRRARNTRRRHTARARAVAPTVTSVVSRARADLRLPAAAEATRSETAPQTPAVKASTTPDRPRPPASQGHRPCAICLTASADLEFPTSREQQSAVELATLKSVHGNQMVAGSDSDDRMGRRVVAPKVGDGRRRTAGGCNRRGRAS